MPPMHMASLLQRAVLELGIDVPVYRTEAGPNGTLTLYLYGGSVAVWQPAPGDGGPEHAFRRAPASERPASEPLKPKKPRRTQA